MKRRVIQMGIIFALVIGVFHFAIAEDNIYSISDFLESGLFPNQYGHMSSDINCLSCMTPGSGPASYEEINEAFPSAIERYYEDAVRLREIIFSQMKENYPAYEELGIKQLYKDENLLYSYWKAKDGVFGVIWMLGYVDDGVSFVAGRSFWFSSIPNLKSTKPEMNGVKDIMQLSRYNGCFFRKMPHVCPSWLMAYLGSFCQVVFVWEDDGEIEFTCYLVGHDEKIICDISFLMEKEFGTLGEYIVETEKGLFRGDERNGGLH